MPRYRVAFIAAALCFAAFIAVMAWDIVVEHPRMAGSQICAQSADAAKLIGAEGPGVYRFDRDTGRPARIPASMAIEMVATGLFNPTYPGQAGCGGRAMTQTGDGVIAVGSLLGAIVALLMGIVAKARRPA